LKNKNINENNFSQKKPRKRSLSESFNEEFKTDPNIRKEELEIPRYDINENNNYK